MAAAWTGVGSVVALFGDRLEEIGRQAERVEGQTWAPAWVPSRARARERDGGPGIRWREWAHRAWAARSIAEIGGAPAHLTRIVRRGMAAMVGLGSSATQAAILRANPQGTTRQTGTTEDRRPHGRNPVTRVGCPHIDGPPGSAHPIRPPDSSAPTPQRRRCPSRRLALALPRRQHPPSSCPSTAFRQGGGKSLAGPAHGAQRASIPPIAPPRWRSDPRARHRASAGFAPTRRPAAAAGVKVVDRRRPGRVAAPSNYITSAKTYAAHARSVRRQGRRDLQPQRHVDAR